MNEWMNEFKDTFNSLSSQQYGLGFHEDLFVGFLIELYGPLKMSWHFSEKFFYLFLVINLMFFFNFFCAAAWNISWISQFGWESFWFFSALLKLKVGLNNVLQLILDMILLVAHSLELIACWKHTVHGIPIPPWTKGDQMQWLEDNLKRIEIPLSKKKMLPAKALVTNIKLPHHSCVMS